MLKGKTVKKPVIILTGYLGSGKTTVMKELLQNQVGRKFAIIVNDMGSVNIDATLLRSGCASTYSNNMIELQNGCICCTLRDQFMVEIEKLSAVPDIEMILVEASGVSDPGNIAQSFMMYQETKPQSPVYLSMVVTVADADRIYAEFLDDLEERTEEEFEDQDPDIINLIMDQIEFCNLILLNKCDLLPRDKLDRVKQALHELQPEAMIVETIQGKVSPALIMNHQQLDYDKVRNSSMVSRTLAGKAETSGQHSEYGITSFVFEDRHPLNRDRFTAFMENDYPGTMIRAKGYIWFSDDDIHVQLFEQAGRNASITEVSNWVVSLPESDQKEVFENYPEILNDWDEVYGDRLNQVVFIGREYNQREIIRKLQDCLA